MVVPIAPARHAFATTGARSCSKPGSCRRRWKICNRRCCSSRVLRRPLFGFCGAVAVVSCATPARLACFGRDAVAGRTGVCPGYIQCLGLLAHQSGLSAAGRARSGVSGRHAEEDTLEKIQGSWLYHGQVRFAELSVLPLTPDNAAYMLDLSKELLHFFPEPIVRQRLMDSATLLDRTDDLAYYGQRFRVAYPDAYARWLAGQ